jgi:aminoacrylate peracid reductase
MAQHAFNPPGRTPASPLYSYGAAGGGLLFTAGIVAVDDQGATQHPGDAKAQTHAVLGTIAQILAARGAGFEDVLMVQIYLRSMADYAAVNAAYAEVFQGLRPARFCVAAGLVRDDWLVEIAVVAAARQEACA